MHANLPAVSLLFAVSAAAQTSISLPAGLPLTGPGSPQVIGWNGPERIQSIYAPAVLPAAGTTITMLRLHPPTGYTYPGMVVDVTLRLASTGVPLPGAASESSFAANRGSAPQTTVLTGISLPALTPSTVAAIDLPLAAPFVRPAGLPLLVEMDVSVVSYSGVFPGWPARTHEYPTEFWDPTRHVLGGGCVAGDMVAQVATAFPPRESAVWTFFGSQPPGTPAVLLLGLSDQVYGVLPLPIDLSYLGAPGCALQVAVHDTHLVFGSTTGYSPQFPTAFQSDVALPRDPRFAGTHVSGQFAILDAAHNAAGVAMTPHARFELTNAPVPERMRYSHSFLAPGSPQDSIQSWLPDRAFVFEAVTN